MPSDHNSPSLNPLDSPVQQPQQAPPTSTLSAQETQERADPMAKTKRRLFANPLLRRSATASSAAAASAASRLKSNLSTVTKLPTALKRSANTHKTTVDREPTIPSLSRSSTDSSVKQEEPKQSNSRKFGIPSLMRIRAGSKDLKRTEGPLDSSEEEHSSRGNNSEDEEVKSGGNTASRFVMGVPAMLRRAVSNNQTSPPTSSANAAAPQKKSPDTSANSTPRGDSPQDEWGENDRHSLLMMMQVPEDQRRSQVPLMAASEAW